MNRKGLDERTHVWLCMQLKPDRVPVRLVSACVVDSGSRCGLHCPFCPTGNGSLTLSRQFMSERRFVGILGRLPALQAMTLYQWGEPLLNADIHGMIAAAARRDVEVTISTHLSLASFDEAAARRLVTSGLARLIVSCDGASQRTYGLYRVGGNFQLVMRNLATLVAARSALGSSGPRIDWQFLVHRGNQHEMALALRKARRLGVGIVFEKLGIPPESQERWSPDPAVLQKIPLQNRYSPRRAWPRRTDKWPTLCLQAWSAPVIRPDGAVLPCCVVSSSRYKLGNILKEPFGKIWNKPLIVAMRRYLKTGARPGLDLPCLDCPHDPNSPDRGQ